ncbi:MAG: hypothetical protein JSS66_10070 [Armatimonadetes bacterium]|nr:hypothetical protein [Armatimonadota bacterium]
MLFAVAIAALTDGWLSLDLSDPVRLKASDQFIDVQHGHAHPFLADMDGDGKRDLIVGQFQDGKARVYKNYATDNTPVYKDFTWFKAGGVQATVPYG